jgi:tRNA dimethylallyltransferase
VPHRLYGHVPGTEAYSAARFAAEAGAAIAEAQQAGRVPIVVGGTGLYFMALTEGLSPIPPVPDDIRSHWRSRAAEIGAAALHAELAARDPVMAARLRPTDPQRLVRALEVLDATGVSLAEWQAKPGEPVVHVEEGRAFVVSRDRADLFARCDARFDAMLAEGAVEEVRALLQLGLSRDLPVIARARRCATGRSDRRGDHAGRRRGGIKNGDASLRQTPDHMGKTQYDVVEMDKLATNEKFSSRIWRL